MGTWIEIWMDYVIKEYGFDVVPLVGTWIEIDPLFIGNFSSMSFPLWERGLKFYDEFLNEDNIYRRSPCGNVD